MLTFLALGAMGCRDTAKETVIPTVNMGERAQAGPLIYTVFDTKWALSLGDQVAPRIPKDRFFIINMSIVNGGGQAAVNVPTLTLVDDEGQSYQELDNGEGVANWMGIARRIRPADSIQGTALFDVPQKRFRLKVSDEEDHAAMITIPLTLGDTSLQPQPAK